MGNKQNLARLKGGRNQIRKKTERNQTMWLTKGCIYSAQRQLKT